MLKGCCYYHDGSYSNTIVLKTLEDVISYIRLQAATGKEARILNDKDQIAMTVIGNYIVFPEISSRRHPAISGECEQNDQQWKMKQNK